jgi:hypothetical protein
MSVDVRRGMPARRLDRDSFVRRFQSRFRDPAFDPLRKEIDAIAATAWDAYADSRKSPLTRKAGPGFADPTYEIAVDWLDAQAAIKAAQQKHERNGAPPNILLINGSSRTEHTCPGEMSKSWRLIEIARETIEAAGAFEVSVLDLSRATSEFGITIHPCKSCAVHGALSLAVQLLPELQPRPGRRLDE